MEKRCEIHDIIFTEPDVCPKCVSPDVQPNNNHPIEPESDAGNRPETSQNTDSADDADGNNLPENPHSSKTDIKPETGNENEFKSLTTDMFNMLQGNSVGNVNFNIQQTLDDSKVIIRLFEESEPCPSNFDELDNSFLKLVSFLESERILLLGESGDGRGLSVSYQIARSLEIENTEENIKLFALADYTRESELIINSFTFERKTTNNKALPNAVVIIDATNIEKGNIFANSLLNPQVSFPQNLLKKLRDNKLFLICLLESQIIDDWKRNSSRRNFPYENIPNSEIEPEPCEDEFENINQSIEVLLNLESDIEGQIIKTVLFVASFFPKLTTSDFNHLVTKWLENKPDLTRTDSAKNGSEETAVTKISLGHTWNLKSHIFTKQCFLSQMGKGTGKRIIDFEHDLHSKCVKEQLESRFFMFLDKKFSDILEFGLIFHASKNISNQSITILSEYVWEIEEKYTEWLLDVFKFLDNVEENPDELRDYFKIEEIRGKYFCYNQLAKLFRAMLRDPSLKTIITRVLDQLIRSRFYESVLILVKLLEYDPNFEELYWFRQLLERGDILTQAKTIGYVFSNLVNTKSSNVFERLNVWLPEENLPVENYSRANKVALTLLIDYYSYQTYIFDKQLYGLEPCQFPLFIFDGKTSANDQLGLIIKYLLHPANFILLSDKLFYIEDVASLLENWTDILCREFEQSDVLRNGKEITKSELPVENEFLTNKEILNILLEQVVLNSDKEKQEEILSVWEGFMKELGVLINDLSVNWKVRKNASKRRKIVRNLIESFKKIKRARR
jgi:hypothetical protein